MDNPGRDEQEDHTEALPMQNHASQLPCFTQNDYIDVIPSAPT